VEQSGEAPEPEQPATQPPDDLPPPVPPTASGDPPDGRWFLIAGILVLVAVVGVLAWTSRPDDGLAEVDRNEERFPTPSTLPPKTTPAVVATSPTPVVTPPPTTVPAPPAPTASPTTVAVTPPPGSVLGEVPGATTVPDPTDDPDYVTGLVPNVAGFAEFLSSPELAKAQVDQMLASGRHDIAVAAPVASICAAIPMDRPLAVRGRWELDGRRVASTDLERRDAPGFGECLTNDGDALRDGSYQYIASDSRGNESAAGGVVVGATLVDQVFRNDGDVDVCAVRIAPTASRYFEVYVYRAQPIVPGSQITIRAAAVDQDVEAVGCDDTELASFSFQPTVGTVQSLTP
jgi:hypothetical protein